MVHWILQLTSILSGFICYNKQSTSKIERRRFPLWVLTKLTIPCTHVKYELSGITLIMLFNQHTGLMLPILGKLFPIKSVTPVMITVAVHQNLFWINYIKSQRPLCSLKGIGQRDELWPIVHSQNK